MILNDVSGSMAYNDKYNFYWIPKSNKISIVTGNPLSSDGYLFMFSLGKSRKQTIDMSMLFDSFLQLYGHNIWKNVITSDRVADFLDRYQFVLNPINIFEKIS